MKSEVCANCGHDKWEHQKGRCLRVLGNVTHVYCPCKKFKAQNQGSSLSGKFILDACCGAKGWWIQKDHPNVVYMDIRKEDKGFIAFRPNTEIKPDVQADYRDIPFPDKSFKLVAWDPPHLNHKESKTDLYLLHYGVLGQKGWEDDLRKAFRELWRVLDDYGVMIFKWSDQRISFKDVLAVFPEKALFGTTSNQRKNSQTRYFTFMKIPSEIFGEKQK